MCLVGLKHAVFNKFQVKCNIFIHNENENKFKYFFQKLCIQVSLIKVLHEENHLFRREHFLSDIISLSDTIVLAPLQQV